MADQIAFVKEHNLEQNILNFGSANKNILIQLYNAADVLLAPSLYEGFGLTILEAMACGLPVITSNVSSLPEVVGDAGIMFDPMDIKSMAEAIYHLQTDPVYCQQLINKGLLRSKYFTWKRTVEQMALNYEKLISFAQESLTEMVV